MTPRFRASPVIVGWVGILLAAAMLLTLAACQSDPPRTDSGLRPVTLIPTRTPTATPRPTLDAARIEPADAAPAPGCSDADIAAHLRDLAAYVPGSGSFVAVQGSQFVLDGAPFRVQGVNYYPSRVSWAAFIGSDLVAIEADFARLQAANVNTVRLFLHYPALFICPEAGAVPDDSAFYWLDALLRLVNVYDLHAILVLNHLPDLQAAPLYTDPGLALARTAFIVRRYHAEPALLAWDVRDAGDLDYLAHADDIPDWLWLPSLTARRGSFERTQVLDWLNRTTAAIRAIDPNHVLTAGWAVDAAAPVPAVDAVSLQHAGDLVRLRERLAALRARTAKPLLLIAAGMTTGNAAATEPAQAQWLRDLARIAAADGLAGWLVWIMYDIPPGVTCWPDPCIPQDLRDRDRPALYYGLWHSDGTRKPAVNALETSARRD